MSSNQDFESYESYETEDGETVIYETDNEKAWIKVNSEVLVSDMR
ncbi:MAG: hypothetical protein SXQ77_00525 [Halobacteria archaeon]|nr:hypothetical protein [Halobacteria archaeon]